MGGGEARKARAEREELTKESELPPRRPVRGLWGSGALSRGVIRLGPNITWLERGGEGSREGQGLPRRPLAGHTLELTFARRDDSPTLAGDDDGDVSRAA